VGATTAGEMRQKSGGFVELWTSLAGDQARRPEINFTTDTLTIFSTTAAGRH